MTNSQTPWILFVSFHTRCWHSNSTLANRASLQVMSEQNTRDVWNRRSKSSIILCYICRTLDGVSAPSVWRWGYTVPLCVLCRGRRKQLHYVRWWTLWWNTQTTCKANVLFVYTWNLMLQLNLYLIVNIFLKTIVQLLFNCIRYWYFEIQTLQTPVVPRYHNEIFNS